MTTLEVAKPASRLYERVSRVIPPITTIKKISAQQTKSHAATVSNPPLVDAAVWAGDRAVAGVVETDKELEPQKNPAARRSFPRKSL